MISAISGYFKSPRPPDFLSVWTHAKCENYKKDVRDYQHSETISDFGLKTNLSIQTSINVSYHYFAQVRSNYSLKGKSVSAKLQYY